MANSPAYKVIDDLIKQSTEDIETLNNFDRVTQAANAYKKAYETAKAAYTNYRKNNLSVWKKRVEKTDENGNVLRNKKGDIIYDYIKKKLDYTQQVYVNKLMTSAYKAAFFFDNQLNDYLDRTAKQVIYVFQDANGNLSLKIASEEQILEKTTFTADYDGIFKKVSNSIQSTAGGKFTLTQQQESQKKLADAAYKGTRNRLKVYQETHRTKEDDSKQASLLMWKAQKTWVIARVQNMGDVKEAYAEAVLDDNFKLKAASDSSQFETHALIAEFFNNYIINVDNAPEVSGSDIIRKDYQYSVKSQGAELASLESYYKVAAAIVAGKSKKGKSLPQQKEDLINWIREQFGISEERNKIVQEIDEMAEEEVKKIVPKALLEIN